MEFSGENISGKESVVSESEKSRNVRINLPYGVAEYFKKYAKEQLILVNQLVGGTDEEKADLIRLRSRLSDALSGQNSFTLRLKGVEVELNYNDIDTCGKTELKDYMQYAASDKIVGKKKSNHPIYDSVVGKDKKEAPQTAMSRAEFAAMLKTDDFSFSPRSLYRQYFEWNPDDGYEGLIRLGFVDFAKNFLRLNSAFVKAGGKDNSSLRETYQKIAKSLKKTKPRPNRIIEWLKP